jgi:hypothetical protein
VTRLWAGRPGFDFRLGQVHFSIHHRVQIGSGAHQAYKMGTGGSVGIALRYGLDDRGSRFRFPAGTGNFSLQHRVQNGSGTHPASYPMGTRGSFPGGKAAEA